MSVWIFEGDTWGHFGYGKSVHPRRWAECCQPQRPAIYLLIAENHSKKNCIIGEKRKTEKKSGRSLVKLGVEQQRGEAEGLRSPAAVTRSLLRAGRRRLLFCAFPFILHIFLIPVPTFLRSESYFYKAEKCWDNSVYASVLLLKMCYSSIIVGIIFVHIKERNW